MHSNKRFILYSGNKFEFRSKDGEHHRLKAAVSLLWLQHHHHICNNISFRAGGAVVHPSDFDYNFQCNDLRG